MARLSKEQEWYNYGMARALEIIKNEGQDALEWECKMRGAYKSCPPMTDALKKQIHTFEHEVKHRCLGTVQVMMCAVLRDEFGFGGIRLERAIERFNAKAECMCDDMCTWDDYKEILNEETGIEFRTFEGD